MGNYVLLYKKEEIKNLSGICRQIVVYNKKKDPDRAKTDGQKERPGTLQAELIN